MDILKVVADEGIPVKSASARASKSNAIADLVVMITGRPQLDMMCKKIMNIEGIDDIERVTT